MSEQITREIFDHMVELAALELSAEEAEYLRQELNNQLRAIDELAAIPLDEEMTLTSHGVPYTTEISADAREDTVAGFERPEDIIAQAPETEDSYVVVPDIPHEELG